MGIKRIIPNLRTIAYCEIEGYAIANLVEKMEAERLDSAPIWTDIKTFPSKPFYGKVDIISAGYPCQPFSVAGNRAGESDPRHLWPFIKRAVATIRPTLCFFENVEGHIADGLKNVMHDLGELGYEYEAGLFTAAEIGAPHKRKRVFIMAVSEYFRRGGGISHHDGEHSQGIQDLQDGVKTVAGSETKGRSRNLPTERLANTPGKHRERHDTKKRSLQRWPARPGETQKTWEPSRTLGNSYGYEQQKSNDAFEKAKKRKGVHADRPGKQPEPFKETKSSLGGDFNGSSNRVDRLRLLGNGVIPDQAALAFEILYNQLTKK